MDILQPFTRCYTYIMMELYHSVFYATQAVTSDNWAAKNADVKLLWRHTVSRKVFVILTEQTSSTKHKHATFNIGLWSETRCVYCRGHKFRSWSMICCINSSECFFVILLWLLQRCMWPPRYAIHSDMYLKICAPSRSEYVASDKGCLPAVWVIIKVWSAPRVLRRMEIAWQHLGQIVSYRSAPSTRWSTFVRLW